MAQSLRRSQFITTFGPGAVLEGPNGPRIIATLDRSDIFDDVRVRPVDYEITDARLASALLGNAGIVRLPSNAELGVSDQRDVYKTFPFPEWALCIKHKILYRKTNRNDAFACPRCPPLPNKYEAYEQVRNQAIRFVSACDQGHLDDVNWGQIVRVLGNQCGGRGCQPRYFRWENSGGSLRQINIVCPECGGRANLGTAYSRDWPCSGRHPELGVDRPTCGARSRIIQRGAANLFLPDLVSALTIPPRATRLHRLLEMQAIRIIIQNVPMNSKGQLIGVLDNLLARNDINKAIYDGIVDSNEDELLRAVADIANTPINQTETTLRIDELAALQTAATYGYPRDSDSGRGFEFEVVQRDVRVIKGPQDHALRITPVSRLRVVMVQRGYRRLETTAPLVDRGSLLDGKVWYPGVELFGEGIFIDLAPPPGTEVQPHFQLQGPQASEWLQASTDVPRYFSDIRIPDPLWVHPVFVWWHTLAHRVISSLSLDCGYSSAALRERVLVREVAGGITGGVLIYTAQPGGDGTLGGLIAQVPAFERVFKKAVDELDSCSNDPLCSESKFELGQINGPACYACLFQSETSCEHRNMLLDRELLIRNMP